LIYFLGKKYKWFRLWYYKISKKWKWGIMGAIDTPELFGTPEKEQPLSDKAYYEMLGDVLN
jgi:hypothetical protein